MIKLEIDEEKILLKLLSTTIPILVWNMALASLLPESYSPEVFWQDIPPYISYPENGFRMAIFILPAIMVLSLETRIQNVGISIYSVGTIVYFTSWILVINSPESIWSTSLLLFTAPAYTSFFWLIGISLVGRKSFIKTFKPGWLYLVLSFAIVFFHTWHAYIIWLRL